VLHSIENCLSKSAHLSKIYYDPKFKTHNERHYFILKLARTYISHVGNIDDKKLHSYGFQQHCDPHSSLNEESLVDSKRMQGACADEHANRMMSCTCVSL